MKKILIAYFSHEGEAYAGGKIVRLKIGNTKVAAQMIQGMTDSDIFRIETLTPYPDNHMETVNIAKEEQQTKARPEIKADSLNRLQYRDTWLPHMVGRDADDRPWIFGKL